ncbi:ATP-binding protein [Pseudomonas sp. St290]|uniref:ATP-binding protein n=1 Tax=Pseudomonas sp. St290 TaxID=1602166 RepID=UPI001BB316E5|nr:ATP-binding protein [Pseudomonas sp. St290]BBH31453.1 putative uncharacterized protein [Pseudomonas sp. St290]
MEQACLFGPKFLEKFVGRNILYDPKVAIVELIANSWDAGASEVKIIWPTPENEQYFSISDNGTGMSEEEFISRWRTLAYDRISSQGDNIIINNKKRTVFGKNGIGRFAGFCFGERYVVETINDGTLIQYEVTIENVSTPFRTNKLKSEKTSKPNGTRIFVSEAAPSRIPESTILSEIGMRFLTDPSFSCYVNGVKVDFSNIPETNISVNEINLEKDKKLKITIIDTIESDKTTKQHGVAWHVNGRLVGEANWKDNGFDEIIDGRSAEAKRHTFIIDADFLSKQDAIKADWTGFNDTPDFNKARDASFEFIKAHILGQTQQKRDQTLSSIKQKQNIQISNLTPLRKERWEKVIIKVQEECPSLSEKDLLKISEILVSLEKSDNKYSLISKLHELKPDQLDSLHNILNDWSLDLAKEVLDELQIRLKLLDELKERVLDTNTREVQDLQPLFHQGLWIFGPEYETIEFTSNEGMTKVIQKLFKSDNTGSRNRPDFAILPDSTVGTYCYPTYDSDGGEIGIDKLVVVELKKPGIAISTDEKAQCWKYVSELIKKGLISRSTRVTCFVLGNEVDPFEKEARRDNDNCIIQPMDYQIVIARAKSRLLKLYDRVKGAPFLEEQRIALGQSIQNQLPFLEDDNVYATQRLQATNSGAPLI